MISSISGISSRVVIKFLIDMKDVKTIKGSVNVAFIKNIKYEEHKHHLWPSRADYVDYVSSKLLSVVHVSTVNSLPGKKEA